MRTLQERNWIRVVGHREVPGRPELLGTPREFLDYFGLKSLDQLPTLAELRDVETIGVQLELPGGEVAVAAEAGETEGEAAAAVAEEGGDVDADLEAETAVEASGDDPELSADADEMDDDEATPTLVASDEHDDDRRFGEPPRDE
jgi:segregation and condensation protein B